MFYYNKMTYSLIIPIYNEQRTLPALLNRLNRLDKKIEIIIIDDGSNDDSKDLLLQSDRFIIIRNKYNIGKGASIRKGVDLASNNNIIFMDGDLEVEIDEIPRLITRFENKNIDVLVGIRWKGNINLDLDINTIGNYLINGLFNLLFKSKLNDVLCCVRILNLKQFKSLNIQSDGFSIEVETMAKLVLRGLIIDEIQIQYNRRTLKEGKKLKISDGWNIIFTMIKIRLLTRPNY